MKNRNSCLSRSHNEILFPHLRLHFLSFYPLSIYNSTWKRKRKWKGKTKITRSRLLLRIGFIILWFLVFIGHLFIISAFPSFSFFISAYFLQRKKKPKRKERERKGRNERWPRKTQIGKITCRAFPRWLFPRLKLIERRENYKLK